MIRRIRDLAPLRSVPKTVEARYYNRVRLALKRLGKPLEVEMGGELRQAAMLLSDHEWLCVDRTRDDLPLLAWTAFAIKERDALHAPVRCTLHLYHSHAGLLIGRVLPTLDRILQQRLAGRP
jgi:hypothetical protein